ncbi:MAG: hypothetical protein UR98_C0039G0003 [Parcubacteria group bacterium GW2011_GWA1_36_12]|nr:MAG: hypothetical protein UR98_C0039G0003 [Parcubacteria group bacterium GW2011_GWA1_36_12]
MCGAFTVSSFMFFHGFKPRMNFEPRYNVRPSQDAPIITPEGIDIARFGLVPPWEKTFNTKFSTINARSETVQTSRLYARLLKEHRALIPANSFFEWVKSDIGKQPYLFKLKKRKQFFFAGLYDTWHKGEKDEHKSFTIITTKPNEFMSRYHDRMPKILEKDQEGPWLKEDNVNFDLFFRDQFPSSQMEAYKVSRLVNSPANDSPAVIEKLSN